METIIFILAALTALTSALLVISSKNPVNSVLFLVLTFFCVAVLYLLLGAQFIAAMQVIVYAGAIMVLFLFVVMLLNLRASQSWERLSPLRSGLGFAAAGGVLLLAVTMLKSSFGGQAPLDPTMGTVASIGETLFQRFILPFEVASVLLLAAIIGAVMMVKRRREETTNSSAAQAETAR